MNSGSRALGIAFSDHRSTSTVAGAVVRADRVVDGLAFSRCTVGGENATETVLQLVADLDRPDVTALLIAGVAPAWFNLLDLHRIHDATGLPTLSISFEASEGLAPAIREQFDGDARDRRLERYESLPSRYALSVNDERVFVRAVGAEVIPEAEGADALAPNCEAARIVRGHTPEGGRPEPLRVARLAARAGRAFVAD